MPLGGCKSFLGGAQIISGGCAPPRKSVPGTGPLLDADLKIRLKLRV
jgi:hypothetical protein